MLHAPERTRFLLPVAARTARWSDIGRVASGRARAAATRERGVLRLLLLATVPATALQLLTSVSGSRIWMTGAGSSLEMSPVSAAGRPTRMHVGATVVLLLIVVLAPAVIAGLGAAIGGGLGMVVLGMVTLHMSVLLLPPLAVTVLRPRPGGIEVARPGASGRTVRLHDLVRHPSDPPGTGVRLLEAVCASPPHRDDRIVARAANERIADVYAEAGLARIAPLEER